MNWLKLLGISVVVLVIFLYEWPRMDKNEVREKRAFIFLACGVWCIAAMLIFFPDVPGPIDLIIYIFKPLENFLNKEW